MKDFRGKNGSRERMRWDGWIDRSIAGWLRGRGLKRFEFLRHIGSFIIHDDASEGIPTPEETAAPGA